MVNTEKYYYVLEYNRNIFFSKRTTDGVLLQGTFWNISCRLDQQRRGFGKLTIRNNPEEIIYPDFDTRSVGVPDIFVDGYQTFK